jgi:hypothetical protein
VDGAIITGIFTLAGTVLGAGLDWLRGAAAQRKADARELQELTAQLSSTCRALTAAAMAWASDLKGSTTPGPRLRAATWPIYGEFSAALQRMFRLTDPAAQKILVNITACASDLMLDLMSEVPVTAAVATADSQALTNFVYELEAAIISEHSRGPRWLRRGGKQAPPPPSLNLPAQGPEPPELSPAE